MRGYAQLFLSFGLIFSLVGCGDSTSSSGGSGGTAGSGGTSGTMVTVTGKVTAASLDDGPGLAVANATVAVVGTSNTATTDPDGNFSVMAPVGTAMFLTTTPGEPNWGSLFAEIVPAGGFAGLDIEVIPDALVDGVGLALGLDMPIDPAEGLVAVVFDEDTTEGGEAAAIDSLAGGSFVFDADDDPVVGTVLIENGGSEVIFFNVDLTNSVTATATGAASQPCSYEFPDATYSVRAKVLTEIDVICPAP